MIITMAVIVGIFVAFMVLFVGGVGAKIGLKLEHIRIPLLLGALGCALIGTIAGGISHRLVDKDGERWEKAAYYMSFPAYGLSFVLIWIVEIIIAVIKSAANSAGSGNSASSDNGEIIITRNGTEHRLIYIDQTVWYGDYKYHNCPCYGKYYKRYHEIICNNISVFIWMSFDDGKTFIREDEFDPWTFKI